MEKASIINKWINGEKTSPLTIEIYPTNKCNLNCKTCLARGKVTYVKKQEVSTKKWLKILNEAANMYIKHIDLCGGGEPLARSDTTTKIMTIIKKRGMRGNLITNGTLFNKKIIDKLVKLKWDNIQISIDGHNSELNDYIRGKGVFDKIIKNIHRINK